MDAILISLSLSVDIVDDRTQKRLNTCFVNNTSRADRASLPYLYTGMRIGEGIPLLWSDIDLEKRMIRVNKKAIVCHNYDDHSAKQEVQNFCKTKSSKRSIMITTGLAAILKEHKKAMQDWSEKLGEDWCEHSLVFRNTHGKMVYSRNLQETLHKIFRNVGIEGATMHTLRHPYP